MSLVIVSTILFVLESIFLFMCTFLYSHRENMNMATSFQININNHAVVSSSFKKKNLDVFVLFLIVDWRIILILSLLYVKKNSFKIIDRILFFVLIFYHLSIPFFPI